MKWRIDSSGNFYDPDGDNLVYFDQDSGDTHLVTRFAGYLIERLGGLPEPAGIEELMELVLEDLEPDASPDLTSKVAEIMNELVSLGIVTQE